MEGATAMTRSSRESTVVRFKERLRFALSLSGKGQNEVAREIGASNSVASEWFDLESDTLPGGKFLGGLVKSLRVNGHWLVTGEGHWHPQASTGRRDLVLLEGIEIGARGVAAEVQKAIDRAHEDYRKLLADTTARAKAVLEDAESGDVARIEDRSTAKRSRRK
jgi:hypothetical protein